MARTPGCSDTPRNEPLPFESDGRLIFQKLAKAHAGLSAHRLTRRRSHAHPGRLIQILGNGNCDAQFNSQWNGETTWAAAPSVRVSSVVWCSGKAIAPPPCLTAACPRAGHFGGLLKQ
jgi:hypothetical protein